MFGRNIKPRRFDYTPKVLKDEEKKDKERRIEFERMPKRVNSSFSIWFLIAAVAVIIYLIIFLQRM